jgi:hypothetical protein
LVLTYAFPSGVLRPLLPPGLVLDTYGEYGFLAIAMVQTERLRPSFLPAAVGRKCFPTRRSRNQTGPSMMPKWALNY